MYKTLTDFRILNSLFPSKSMKNFLEENILENNSHFELLLLKIK